MLIQRRKRRACGNKPSAGRPGGPDGATPSTYKRTPANCDNHSRHPHTDVGADGRYRLIPGRAGAS